VIKRMTLLARKQGLSTEDFRAHWAGPHAQLALRMAGIARYVQNRVEEPLWHTGSAPAFDVDGIVELFFTDTEAMRLAQASDIGTTLIPEDEPRFLKGWTLCVVESEGDESTGRGVKVLAPFRAPARALRGRLDDLQREPRAAVVGTASADRLPLAALRQRGAGPRGLRGRIAAAARHRVACGRRRRLAGRCPRDPRVIGSLTCKFGC
jgi:uncharacterized protein (TIGR02118 family)